MVIPNPPWSDASLIEQKLDQLHTDNQALTDAIKAITLTAPGPPTSLATTLPPGEDSGTASSGTTTTLLDNTKNWLSAMWFSSLLYVVIDNVVYTTTVTGNSYNGLIFGELPVAVKPGSPYAIHNVVSRIASGQMRPGIALMSNQRLLVFGFSTCFFSLSLSPI